MTDLLADRSSWTLENCSLAHALDLVGNRISMLLVREAFLGTRRFDDLAARVGVSEPAAARRLAELTAHGILEKVPYREAGQRERHEYHLTPMGRDLLPVVTALRDWGDRWASGTQGPPFHAVHTGCGAPVQAVVRCTEGHVVVAGRTTLLAGPAPSGPAPGVG